MHKYFSYDNTKLTATSYSVNFCLIVMFGFCPMDASMFHISFAQCTG